MGCPEGRRSHKASSVLNQIWYLKVSKWVAELENQKICFPRCLGAFGECSGPLGSYFEPPQPTKDLETAPNQIFTPLLGNSTYLPLLLRYVHLNAPPLWSQAGKSAADRSLLREPLDTMPLL